MPAPDKTLDLAELKVIAKEDATALRDLFQETASAAQETGGAAVELGRLLADGLNPAQTGLQPLLDGMQAYFSWQEKVQEKLKDIAADGQKVNQVLADIVKSPANTQSWVEFTQQIAKLRETSENSKFVSDPFSRTQKSMDENRAGAGNALDFEQSGLERRAISEEIANTAVALNQAIATGGKVANAQLQANQSRDHLAAHKTRIEKVPEAMRLAQANAGEARKAGNNAFLPDERMKYRKPANEPDDQAGPLPKQLELARSQFPGAAQTEADAESHLRTAQDNHAEIGRLREQITSLQNRLGVFDNHPFDPTRPKPIQAIMDAPDSSGQTLERMGAVLHLTQQQIVTAVTRILDHQDNWQRIAAGMHQRLDAQERQAAALIRWQANNRGTVP